MDPKLPIRATTQEQIPIEDIQEDLVILKNAACCLIVSVTALNFSLLSETEQEAIIYSYAAFLNSLAFPIQILIRSKRKDISSYLRTLLETESKQTNQLLKDQIVKYRKFIGEMIKKNNVLDKDFFIVIPFNPAELGVAQAAGSAFSRKKTSLPFSKEYLVEKAKISLTPKRDHVIRQLARAGLFAKQLTTEELVSLFYEIYNQDQGNIPKIPAEAQFTAISVQTDSKIKPEETNKPVTA